MLSWRAFIASMSSVLSVCTFSTSANAEGSISDLLRSGYELVWEGYAAIETCVHDDDVHRLGQFVFVCDRFTYEYPYHYGNVFLLAKLVVAGDQHSIRSFICLDDEDLCIEGSLYRQ